MNDLSTTVQQLDRSCLATLFELSKDTDLRSPDALHEALEHLLAAPIENVLNQLPRELADKLRQRSTTTGVVLSARQTGVNTFGELFQHPHPPIELLKFAKDLGKATVVQPQTVWPREACEMLYYASYAAALVRGHGRIGNLGKADLLGGFRQLAARNWAMKEIRVLLEKAAQQLSANHAPL